MTEFNSISSDVKLGRNVRLSPFINLYGCQIGDETKIGAFVEIQKNARVGNRCKISSHSFICEGVNIEDHVFIGHSVTFTNDRYPRAANADGSLQTEADWTVQPTVVKQGVSIGSGSTILPGLTIGENAMVGAGSVVTHDVPPDTIVAGNPARVIRSLKAAALSAEPASIPFLDLITPHRELEHELVSVFRESLNTASFVGGSRVEEFEKDFASLCGAAHCVGVGSGTDALRFALMASGVKPGDSVITVPNTFIATAEAISQAGALPEFVDVEERTANMSVVRLRHFLEKECARDESGKLISFRSGRPVSAIVPVHLFGQMADMDPILQLAHDYELVVVEDACQAHGAEYNSQENGRWMKAGSMGHAAAFSFYPGKNLGACGEGGAVTTNHPLVTRMVKMLRDHGQVRKYCHEFEGYNGRLDTIQAAILRVKLPHLERWNQQRRERAAEYNRLLANHEGLILPHEPSCTRSVYHVYAIRSNDRSGFMNHMKMAGISTGIHYPIPLHLQQAYSDLNYTRGDFPIAERLCAEIVSLPMYPHLTKEQQSRVAEEALAFISEAKSALSSRD
jgi:dTDP-4-amino-4,6-dideoxygalactose transaminase/acetyltransferase-like isoleucine patch superfamily enzyme